eukprot:TRINITY_DN2955_c0_g1_i22.p2 TRINITY_DN2955_c0_g1~~TRINITY_DN2955_c0_g1_i22.p2  ORF type:complete len:109 (-),score=7.82 TRINITY_DN2955_c0_g1_i22:166-492(-)
MLNATCVLNFDADMCSFRRAAGRQLVPLPSDVLTPSFVRARLQMFFVHVSHTCMASPAQILPIEFTPNDESSTLCTGWQSVAFLDHLKVRTAAIVVLMASHGSGMTWI